MYRYVAPIGSPDVMHHSLDPLSVKYGYPWRQLWVAGLGTGRAISCTTGWTSGNGRRSSARECGHVAVDKGRPDVYVAPMQPEVEKNAPGQVRDAIIRVMQFSSDGLSAKQIAERVAKVNGHTPESSIRSYLRLNTPDVFIRQRRGVYQLNAGDGSHWQYPLAHGAPWQEPFRFGNATLVHGDCFDWLDSQNDNSIHAVVTDPPYGLQEYTPKEQSKLRNGKGGVWRIPPSYDGRLRAPIPRFTTLTPCSEGDSYASSSSSGRNFFPPS